MPFWSYDSKRTWYFDMVPGSTLTVFRLTRIVAQFLDRDLPEPEDCQRPVLLHQVTGVLKNAVALEVPGHLKRINMEQNPIKIYSEIENSFSQNKYFLVLCTRIRVDKQ